MTREFEPGSRNFPLHLSLFLLSRFPVAQEDPVVLPAMGLRDFGWQRDLQPPEILRGREIDVAEVEVAEAVAERSTEVFHVRLLRWRTRIEMRIRLHPELTLGPFVRFWAGGDDL